jgi:hypothetical protein
MRQLQSLIRYGQPLFSVHCSLVVRCNIRHRQIPVGEENLEAALLLALILSLVRPELLGEGVLVGIGGGGRGGILVDNGDAIVPAAVLGGVVGRGLDLDGENTACGLNFLEQRVVVFEKEREEFLLMAPLALVVVLDGVGLAGRALRGCALRVKRGERRGEEKREEGEEESAMGPPVVEMEAL